MVAGWGDDDYLRTLESTIENLDLHDNVILLGPVFGSDKAAALSHASAFVLASHSEGQPMAVLEAWSYGLPVAMTPECNMPDGFTRGAAIEISASSESLTTSLHEFLLLSSGALEDIGFAGRKLVNQEYTWKMVARKFSSLYDELV